MIDNFDLTPPDATPTPKGAAPVPMADCEACNARTPAADRMKMFMSARLVCRKCYIKLTKNINPLFGDDNGSTSGLFATGS